MTFQEAVKRWALAQRRCVAARIVYERRHAEALIRATGKASEIRKAQADVAAITEFEAYELAQIEAKALEHTVDYLKSQRSQGAAAA